MSESEEAPHSSGQTGGTPSHKLDGEITLAGQPDQAVNGWDADVSPAGRARLIDVDVSSVGGDQRIGSVPPAPASRGREAGHRGAPRQVGELLPEMLERISPPEPPDRPDHQ